MEEHYNDLVKVFFAKGLVMAIKYFLENVKNGGSWDLKAQSEWDLSSQKRYIYNGIPLRFDEVGNVHFGYVGSFLFDLDTLQIGAGIYQIISGTSDLSYWNSGFDDPLDSAAIKYGYMLKNKRIIQGFNLITLESYEEYYRRIKR